MKRTRKAIARSNFQLIRTGTNVSSSFEFDLVGSATALTLVLYDSIVNIVIQYRNRRYITGQVGSVGCGWGDMVARSHNEICVTRGPMSPQLTLPLLSLVRFSSGALQ